MGEGIGPYRRTTDECNLFLESPLEDDELLGNVKRHVSGNSVLLAVQTGLYFVFSVLYLTSIMAFILLFSIILRIYLMSIIA